MLGGACRKRTVLWKRKESERRIEHGDFVGRKGRVDKVI
jgi:hypothetical protein